MFLKFKLLTFNIVSVSLMIFFLCLGSQNLKERHSLNFLTFETVLLPNGFLVGNAFILGFLTGGITANLITNSEKI